MPEGGQKSRTAIQILQDENSAALLKFIVVGYYDAVSVKVINMITLILLFLQLCLMIIYPIKVLIIINIVLTFDKMGVPEKQIAGTGIV